VPVPDGAEPAPTASKDHPAPSPATSAAARTSPGTLARSLAPDSVHTAVAAVAVGARRGSGASPPMPSRSLNGPKAEPKVEPKAPVLPPSGGAVASGSAGGGAPLAASGAGPAGVQPPVVAVVGGSAAPSAATSGAVGGSGSGSSVSGGPEEEVAPPATPPPPASPPLPPRQVPVTLQGTVYVGEPECCVLCVCFVLLFACAEVGTGCVVCGVWRGVQGVSSAGSLETRHYPCGCVHVCGVCVKPCSCAGYVWL
jgi:hypothetical protein